MNIHSLSHPSHRGSKQKISIKEFIRRQFRKFPNITKDNLYRKVKEAFPKSRYKRTDISIYKHALRQEGMEIPHADGYYYE